jgi:hypothetical protein
LFHHGPREASIEQIVATYQGGPDCWKTRDARCANGETWAPGKAGSIELSIQQFVARVNTYMGHVQKVPWTIVPVKPITPPPGTPTIYTLAGDFRFCTEGLGVSSGPRCDGSWKGAAAGTSS